MRFRMLGRAIPALILIASLWALVNILYVYGVRDGNHEFRIETAGFILVAVSLPSLLRRYHPVSECQPSARLEWLGPALLTTSLLVWLAELWPVTRLPFLSDDYVFLALYRSPGDLLTRTEFFRPAFATAFWALACAGRGSPVLFHLASALLHGALVFFVFRLSLRILGQRWPAFVAAALFLLNPLQLEPVLWASRLQELLWTFFVLAALDTYTGARTLTVGRAAATLVFVALGLASKETAVCAAVLLPAADYLFFDFKRGRLLVPAWIALGCELAAYLVVRGAFVRLDTSHAAVSRYVAKQFITTPYRVFIQPWNEALHPPTVLPLLAAVSALALFTAYVLGPRSSRRVFVGPAVILVSTLPLHGLFFVGSDLFVARYVYFAAAGWGLLLGFVLFEVIADTRVRSFVALAAGRTT